MQLVEISDISSSEFLSEKDELVLKNPSQKLVPVNIAHSGILTPAKI